MVSNSYSIPFTFFLPLLDGLLLKLGLHAKELSIARISDHAVELRLAQAIDTAPASPMLAVFPREEKWHRPVEQAPPPVDMGGLLLEIERSPLTITAGRKNGELVQKLTWQADGAARSTSLVSESCAPPEYRSAFRADQTSGKCG